MTFNAFIIKWQGKYCEVAGSANAKWQCVDAANLYIRDVLLLPIIEWTNAVDFPSKAGDKYEYIVNSPLNIPKEGDLIIWKPTPGHIAIFIEGSVDSFKSFDQNFPIGSPCHIQNHNYTNVTGWLRVKAPSSNTSELEKCATARNSHWDDLQTIKGDLSVVGEYSLELIRKRIQSLQEAEREYGTKEKQLQEAQTQITDLKTEVTRLQETNTTQATEASILTEKATDLEKKYTQSTQNYEEALRKIHILEGTITKLPVSGFQKIWEGIKELLKVGD